MLDSPTVVVEPLVVESLIERRQTRSESEQEGVAIMSEGSTSAEGDVLSGALPAASPVAGVLSVVGEAADAVLL